MSYFVKTESFTIETKKLPLEVRQQYLAQHRSWVSELNKSGTRISSGYLVDKHSAPGGGGLLIIEADSYQEAFSIIQMDPMIISGLVHWDLQEFVSVSGPKLIA